MGLPQSLSALACHTLEDHLYLILKMGCSLLRVDIGLVRVRVPLCSEYRTNHKRDTEIRETELC